MHQRANFFVTQLLVLAQHQNLSFIARQLFQRPAYPDSGVRCGRAAAGIDALVEVFVFAHFAPRFAPLRVHHMHRHPVQITAKSRAWLVSRRVAQHRQKALLGHFLRPSRVIDAPPEEPVHRFAIAFKKLPKRFPRARLKRQHQLFVGIHRGQALLQARANFFDGWLTPMECREGPKSSRPLRKSSGYDLTINPNEARSDSDSPGIQSANVTVMVVSTSTGCPASEVGSCHQSFTAITQSKVCGRNHRKYWLYAPIASRRLFARESVHRRTSSSCSASTITRANGSVPEYRSTTRPDLPSAVSAATSSRETSGKASSGGLDLSLTLTIFCGNTFSAVRSSSSGPASAMIDAILTAVNIPSPVVASS